MNLHFHRWGTWSDPLREDREEEDISLLGRHTRPVLFVTQQRMCRTCGYVQVRATVVRPVEVPDAFKKAIR